MSAALLAGLGPSSQFLLHVAALQEMVPIQLAARPPLDEDPVEAAEALAERGLITTTDVAGVLALSPMGYALRDEILDGWDALHATLRSRLIRLLAQAFDLPKGGALHQALNRIDRGDFIPKSLRFFADLDTPAPIGIDKMTTSAPHAIVCILQAIAPKPGERVLICGAKGGVTLALCADMVGETGAAIALDWSKETVNHVESALAGYPHLRERVDVIHQPDVTIGRPGDAPFDVVVINGSVPKVPRDLLAQLNDGGRMLIFLQASDGPGQACFVLHKNGGFVQDELLSRFQFTPIFGRWGWDTIEDFA